MKIAVIPARGGSKRIPNKNIKLFYGKPMIAWSIEAALKTALFDKVIVSTDDDKISSIAESYGAETPFIRPSALADDYTSTTDVVAHATNWAINHGFDVGDVCCIYATAPFIRSSDVISGWNVINNSQWNFVFSATESTVSVHRSFFLDDNGGVRMVFPKNYYTRSQDLKPVYHDAGQFYWGKASAWLQKLQIFEEYSLPLKLPKWRVQDIDDPDDWLRAEALAEFVFNDAK